MTISVKVENVSKQYRLGKVGTGSLANDLNRWWHLMRGKEDPYLKIGDENERTTLGNSDYIWALRNINFEVEKGDAVGIIGRNGAGKSTLLKILSRTTAPTTGDIKLRGRIASLLEVGTGFHPELSGRENIFLNGAILGMTKKEIIRKFDEIVDFAGVARYIDTPVKRYSSGMYVRLAFAVAAHLESEILIVDEVLAVGDMEFQRKCLGKMNDMSKGEGRTVLFVSHNMGAVKALCKKGIYMENGNIKEYADVDNVIKSYFKKDYETSGTFTSEKLKKDEIVYVKEVTLRNQHGEITDSFKTGDKLRIDLVLNSDEHIEKPNIAVGIKSAGGFVTIANTMWDSCQMEKLRIGENHVSIQFPELPLLPNEYYIIIGMRSYDGKKFLMVTKELGYFAVTTRMADLGILKPFAEEAAMDSTSPMLPYTWTFEGKDVQSFDILKHARQSK